MGARQRPGKPVNAAAVELVPKEVPKDARIRLQFVLADDLASRAIAWWGQGYGGFSHVDAMLPNGYLLGARSDAVGGQRAGVEVRPPDYERWIRKAVVELPVTAEKALSWEGWLRKQLNEPYDSDAIWGFVLGRKSHTRGHWICSALQTGALRRIGELYPNPIPDSQTTPDALFQLVTAGRGGRVI